MDFTWISEWLQPILCFCSQFYCKLLDWLFQALVEIMDIVLGLTAWIPVPDALLSWQWPDAGPLGGALILFGFPNALLILTAAFTVRFFRSLIPFIRS